MFRVICCGELSTTEASLGRLYTELEVYMGVCMDTEGRRV